MREITSHKVNGCNGQLTIEVRDEPGAGGACHYYAISGFDTTSNPSADATTKGDSFLKVLFQNGPILEAGVNGITQEALLAIVIDRLESFQAGPYACEENAKALECVQDAVHWLHSRTTARMARGVEGTHEK